jgi:hypothetical protein
MNSKGEHLNDEQLAKLSLREDIINELNSLNADTAQLLESLEQAVQQQLSLKNSGELKRSKDGLKKSRDDLSNTFRGAKSPIRSSSETIEANCQTEAAVPAQTSPSHVQALQRELNTAPTPTQAPDVSGSKKQNRANLSSSWGNTQKNSSLSLAAIQVP